MTRNALLTLGAVAALELTACAHRQHKPPGTDLPLPVMPLAQSHIPPVPTVAPTASDDVAIPMRIAHVARRGHAIALAWDAPGATQAVLSFSVDGTVFRTIERTSEPAAVFVPGAAHGIIRIFVTDGRRHNFVDYRM